MRRYGIQKDVSPSFITSVYTVCTDRDLCYTGTTSFYFPFKKSGYSKGMNGKNWTDNLISTNCKQINLQEESKINEDSQSFRFYSFFAF